MKTVRNTTAKTKIQELISSSPITLSHTEIQSATNGLCDRVAIYRVLERLTDEGLIHKIVNVDGVVKYASCHSCSVKHNHNHIHLAVKDAEQLLVLTMLSRHLSCPKNIRSAK